MRITTDAPADRWMAGPNQQTFAAAATVMNEGGRLCRDILSEERDLFLFASCLNDVELGIKLFREKS